MSDLPTREEAERIRVRLAEGPLGVVQPSDVEDVAMAARCLVAVAEGRLMDRETIDYEAATAKAEEQEPWAGGPALGMDSYAKNIVDAAIKEGET